jgi:Zn finger protein HypA/HybF involved in hydrogenase expression
VPEVSVAEMSEFDRAAKNPGGMECSICGVIFVGEEWHLMCRQCAETADSLHDNEGVDEL